VYVVFLVAFISHRVNHLRGAKSFAHLDAEGMVKAFRSKALPRMYFNKEANEMHKR